MNRKRIFRIFPATIAAVSTLVIILTVTLLATNMAVSKPNRQTDCSACHGPGTGTYYTSVTATPSTSQPTAGSTYTVSVNITNNPAGDFNTGYWIADSNAAGATYGSTGVYGGGSTPNQSYNATMVAPTQPGTYYYRVFGQDGPPDVRGQTGRALYSITVPQASISDRYYYLPWYDSTAQWGMKTWINISNVTDHDITAIVSVGSQAMGTKVIPAGGQENLNYPDLNGGPVIVRIPDGITSGDKLVVSERSLFKRSFNETFAMDKAEAVSAYAFPWYDNNASWGMVGDWIAIVNTESTDATVDIYIDNMGAPAITKTLAPGAVEAFQMPSTISNGPVKVVARSGKKIVASQRVLYYDSFNEVMGEPIV